MISVTRHGLTRPRYRPPGSIRTQRHVKITGASRSPPAAAPGRPAPAGARLRPRAGQPIEGAPAGSLLTAHWRLAQVTAQGRPRTAGHRTPDSRHRVGGTRPIRHTPKLGNIE